MTTSVPHVDVQTIGDARVITFTSPELTDAAFIKIVGDEIYEKLKDDETPKVVVDFGRVERLSSAAIGMLVALKKVIVDKKGGQIRLSNVEPSLVDIFKMTKVDKVIKIHASNDEAVGSFK